MSYHNSQFRPRPRGVSDSRSRGGDAGYGEANSRMPFRSYPSSADRGRYISHSVNYSSERPVHSYRENNEKRAGDRSRSPRDGNTGRSKEHSREHSDMNRYDKASRHHESRYSNSVHEKGNKVTAQHDTKIAAVEKAKEMALRTREIISKLGGLKQLTSIPNSSPHQLAEESSVLDSKQLSSTRSSPPENVIGKNQRIGSGETRSTFNKIMQNESLIKYAFTLPMNDSSDEYSDRKTEPSMLERSVDSRIATKAVSIEQESVSMDSEPYETAEDIESSQLFDYSYGMPSTNAKTSWLENSSSSSPIIPPAAVTTKASDLPGWQRGTGVDSITTSCDPTIANILKSIGFNFDMSNLMQEKAVQEKVINTAGVNDPKPAVAPLSSSAGSLAQNFSESAKVKLSQTNVTRQSYQDMAHQYLIQQRKGLGVYDAQAESMVKPAVGNSSSSSLQQLQSSYEASEVPFKEDIFRDSNFEMKLKFKVAEVKADRKDGPMYEDFSDSDESFADTACGKPSVRDNFDLSVATSELPTGNDHPLTGGSGHLVGRTSAAEEHDWVQSTEEFIRKLQQPRVQPPVPVEKESVRQVTIKSKKQQQSMRSASTPRREDVASSTLDNPKDHIKLMETIMPLEELKNIKKTIVIGSGVGASKAEKSDVVDNTVRASRSSDRSDSRNDTRKHSSRFDKSDLRNELNKSKDKNVANKNRESERSSDTKDKGAKSSETGLETVENSQNSLNRSASTSREFLLDGSPPAVDQRVLYRQKRIKALVKELECLRIQQSALLRRKKREKDGHKDPILNENSKLQEAISKEIIKLKKACINIEANPNQISPVKTLLGAKIKDDSKFHEKEKSSSKKNKSKAQKTKTSEDLTEDKKPNRRSYRERSKSRSAERKHESETSADGALKDKRKFEYFDGGNHFCRCCNHVSINIFEHCQHLLTAAHKQNMDTTDKPWSKFPTKPAKLDTSKKFGNIVSLRLRGVEFLMPTEAYFCSLCSEFIGSSVLAESHFKDEQHNKNYRRYIAENPYYERRMDLEISAMSVMAPKTQPSITEIKSLKLSDQAVTASGNIGLAMEEAKARAKRLASLSALAIKEDEDLDILHPPVKKSRVIPKTTTTSKPDDEKLAELLLPKADTSKPDGIVLGKAEPAETAQTSSQKRPDPTENKIVPETSSNKAELSAVPTKKSLPFIGKRPNLKVARGARNVSSDQAVDKTMFSVPLKTDLVEASKSEDVSLELVKTAPLTKEMDYSVNDNIHVMDMEIEDSDDLGSFLTIGNSQSGKFQSVPVVKADTVGPPTLSTFLLLSQSGNSTYGSQPDNTCEDKEAKQGDDERATHNLHTDKQVQDSLQLDVYKIPKTEIVSAEIGSEETSSASSISLAMYPSETAVAINCQAKLNSLDNTEFQAPDKVPLAELEVVFSSTEKSPPELDLTPCKFPENQRSCVNICNSMQSTTEPGMVDSKFLPETKNALFSDGGLLERLPTAMVLTNASSASSEVVPPSLVIPADKPLLLPEVETVGENNVAVLKTHRAQLMKACDESASVIDNDGLPSTLSFEVFLPSTSFSTLPEQLSCNDSASIVSATTVIPIQTLYARSANSEDSKDQFLIGQSIAKENDVPQIVTNEVEDRSRNPIVADGIVSMYSASSSDDKEQPNKDVELSPPHMSTENDEATEDYSTSDEPVKRVVRDEEIANLLPGISKQFMEPATSGTVEMAVNFGDFEVIDECDADDDVEAV